RVRSFRWPSPNAAFLSIGRSKGFATRPRCRFPRARPRGRPTEGPDITPILRNANGPTRWAKIPIRQRTAPLVIGVAPMGARALAPAEGAPTIGKKARSDRYLRTESETLATYEPAEPDNAISRTAYYTLAVRAWDAARPRPACGDHYAAMLMNAEARDVWEQFKALDRPNASNATRHGIIDDALRAELGENPAARVVVIGAGFDTRAFRLRGGRWFEVDEPDLLEEKERRLPAARAQNPLTRV